MSSTPGSTSGSGGAAKRVRVERAWRGVGSDTPLRKYTPTPTGGTAPLHSTEDYGYADFYPATDGQGEGPLDERAIRYGHVDVAVVANEYASAHEVVCERLQDTRVFQELQAFAAGVAQRQRARGQITGAEVPELPKRTTRSEERSEEWMRALGNARVPLSTLAVGMPHGVRGERLLEALRTHRVPLQRAMWAIRMTGVHEMVGMQTRAPDHASIKALEHQYTGQWSRHFTQFVEHTLAAAPTGGSGSGSVAATPAMPASESASPAPPVGAASAATPEAWAQRWSYCLALLHAQYSQGLLDQRHMVSWFGTQLAQMAVDRCMLLLPVIRDYTAEIAKSRTPLRRLIGAVVQRMGQAGKYRALQPMQAALGEYLVELFAAHPDAFVEPSTWGPYRAALETAADAVPGEPQRSTLRCAVAQVDSRNAHFAGLAGSSGSSDAATRPPASADARLARLQALGPDSDLDKAFAELFGAGSTEVAAHTLRLLFYWAIEGPLPAASAAARFRPLAAARLCRLHLDDLAAAGGDGALRRRRMQGAIVGFLDVVALPDDERRAAAVRRVCVLLERLGDVGCFAVSHYLQLLTARGDFFGDNLGSLRSQRHLAYAAAVPANTPEDQRQRRMLMGDCGGLATCPPVESLAACDEMRAGLCAQLPLLVAYACGEPVRAGARRQAPAVDAQIVAWWHQAMAGAQDACTQERIAPVADAAADERALGGDLPRALLALLRGGPRAATDFVVLRRLLPIVYDYVVKDVTVGVDNWRVITQPGSSLLNRRQAAFVIRVLAAADYPAQLLDLLLWLLAHTQAASVAALVHSVLRGHARTWALLDRTAEVVAAVSNALHAGADAFDGECYRTAQLLHAEFPGLADELWADATRAYDAHAAAQAPALLQGAHAPTAQAGKELAQLAQQLARSRMRAGGDGAAADDPSWAVTPCFQKLARWAAHAAHRAGAIASSPAVLIPDTPGSPVGGASHQQALLSLFSHIVAEATRAALHSGWPLAPPDSPDRLHDETLLRVQADVCAQLVRWVAQGAGLAAAPEVTGAMILQALGATIGSWTLSWNAAPTSLGPSDAGSNSRLSAAEIGVAVYASRAWAGCLLASGCLRIDELLPWLIGKCCEPATQQNAAQFACLAGIIGALGTPAEEPRSLHELLAVGACWGVALRTNRVCRIQAVELVITSASAAGRLREFGAAQIAVVLMQAAAELAPSPWIQDIADVIPSSEADSRMRGAEYYTMLEIYHANIDAQIRDPAVALPVKRAVLRALLALCEGVDPDSEGFSAMTTAEVAHRVRRTVRRFWLGAAAGAGRTAAAVSKLATILNALLLFASTALQESEATAEAFAVAAGAGLPAARENTGSLDHAADCTQFVTNATADLAACVQDAVFGWHLDADADPDAAGHRGAAVAERRCAALGDALSTLPPDMLQQLVGCFAQTLFALCPARLRAASDGASSPDDDDDSPRQQLVPPPAALDARAGAVIDASLADVRELVEQPLAETKDADDDAPHPSEIARRGDALALLARKLLVALGASIAADANSAGFAPGSPLASVRDFACGILGQLQSIACHTSPAAAVRLALHGAAQRVEEGGQEAGVAVDPARLRLAVAWRVEAVRPLCHLLRAFPDEFAVGEWLTTLVSLCLAPTVHRAAGGLFADLLDLAAVVNESLTTPIRKHALARLRAVVPLLQSAALRPESAEILGRLLPFETSTALTSDIAAEAPGLDNPWMWIEGLEFVPLAPLAATAAARAPAGLEGMTPFTLRGMLEHESAVRRDADVEGLPSRLQYLNNPYFPMQPALMFPLAQTPIPWAVFGAKRRRIDAETRLIWRARCHAAFGS